MIYQVIEHKKTGECFLRLDAREDLDGIHISGPVDRREVNAWSFQVADFYPDPDHDTEEYRVLEVY